MLINRMDMFCSTHLVRAHAPHNYIDSAAAVAAAKQPNIGETGGGWEFDYKP